jgi:hypothetical protein
LIGCIVAATAKTIPSLIGAIVLIGLAASTQLSFPIVSNELVPMKYRFLTPRPSFYIQTQVGEGECFLQSLSEIS